MLGAHSQPPSASLTKTELPAPYGPWMDIALQLPQLITGHQLRSRVHQVWCPPGMGFSCSPSCAQGSPRPWSDTAESKTCKNNPAAQMCAEPGLTPGDSKGLTLDRNNSWTRSKCSARAGAGPCRCHNNRVSSQPCFLPKEHRCSISSGSAFGHTGTSCSHGHPSTRRRDSFLRTIPGISGPAHKAGAVQQEQILQSGWEGSLKGRGQAPGGLPWLAGQGALALLALLLAPKGLPGRCPR